MGMIPKSTKAEIKIGRIPLFRALILVITLIASFGLSSKFFEKILFRLMFSILLFIIAVVLTGRAPGNPRRKFPYGLKAFIFNIIEPHKYYGNETEQYQEYKRKEDFKNAEKAKKVQEKQDRKAERKRGKTERKSRKKKAKDSIGSVS